MSATTTLAVLHFLRDAYAHRWQPTAEQVKTWAVLLSDVPPEDLQRAAVHYARTHEHPPSVSELRKLAAPVEDATTGDEAFEWARKAARHASPYSSERCSQAWAALEKKDPVAAQACHEFGGFRAFWEMLTDDVPTQRAQFRRLYEGMKGRDTHEREADGAAQLIERAVNARQVEKGSEPRKLL